jgi:hypothetical protein
VQVALARIPISLAAEENSFSVFTEDSFDFDPRFWQCGPQAYLVGYWQRIGFTCGGNRCECFPGSLEVDRTDN